MPAAWPFSQPSHLPTGELSCVITHPVYGSLPFTASKDDPDERGRATYAAIMARGQIAAYVAPIVVVGTSAPIVVL